MKKPNHSLSLAAARQRSNQDKLSFNELGLSRDARRLLSESVSPNTAKAMRSDLKVYQRAGGVLPASEIEIANYLSAQNALGKKPATLERYANSLHMWHRFHNLPSPVRTITVRSVLRGIKKSRDTRQKSAPALRLKELHSLLDAIDRKTLHGLRDSTIFLLSFYGAFRRSEVVALTYQDIEWRPEGIIITLRHSKTNRSGRIETKSLMRAPSDTSYCPVATLEQWLAASGIVKGAIFRGVSAKGKLGAGRMVPQTLYIRMLKALDKAGLASKGYTPHSFRAGFITEAHLRGKSDVQIKRVSGHRDQNTFERYIRIADEFENNAGDFF
ncbi:site-specific integrase [Halomonas sp. GFAJ-1]|uniref:site-specific integrase n=1 Tax=Halomonas sp. GFAJ-1 TaxID=1118153 RepID=UPI00023A468E|nr:site-specific integrase [Halomonas sp. GFAJ-1]AVI62917.1 integrase [Halomonas sp. GFAJ-1]EHK62038.1 integrase family protein [Halomonas sp. GFAJ-1]